MMTQAALLRIHGDICKIPYETSVNNLSRDAVFHLFGVDCAREGRILIKVIHAQFHEPAKPMPAQFSQNNDVGNAQIDGVK